MTRINKPAAPARPAATRPAARRTAAAAPPPRPLCLAAVDRGVDELWRTRAAAVAEAKRLEAAIATAESALPCWAQPGPKWMRADGSYFDVETVDDWSTEPEIENAEPPLLTPSLRGVRNVRPSLDDIRADFDRIVTFRHLSRSAARALYRQRIRALIARRRQLRAERERRGIHEMERRLTGLSEQRIPELDAAILASSPSAPALAARFLLAQMGRDDGLPGGPAFADEVFVLRFIRPHLAGELAPAVDAFLEVAGEDEVRDLPWWW